MNELTIAELLISIGVDPTEAKRGAKAAKAAMGDVEKSAEEMAKSTDKGGTSLKRMAKNAEVAGKVAKGAAVAMAAVTTAVGALGRGALGTGAEFEKLRAQLKTATGSAQGAEKALSFVREFAKNTPFQVSEITDAFIKLTNLGLEPSERALTAYGDTSSAMGRDLNQMIEAVADATTGEFERLKEFGIKASSQGDQVAFTFKGITTTVGKNAEEIEDYLIRLGEQNFSGAMSEQMGTLNGLISNLKDAWDSFMLEVANSGPMEEFKGLVADLRDVTGERSGLARTLGKALVSAIKAVRRALKGGLIQAVEVLAEALVFAVENFDKMVALFAAAKTVQGFGAIAQGFSAMGVAATGALGPIGAVAAAIIALIPVITRASKELDSFLAKRQGLDGGTAKGRGQQRVIGEMNLSEETARSLRVANRVLELKRKTMLEAEESGNSAAIRVARQSLNEAERNASALLERASAEDAQRRDAELQADIARGEDPNAPLPDIGPQLPDGGLEPLKKPKKRKGGGRKAKAKKSITSPTTVSDFFRAAAAGELGPIAARTPSVADIEPTVAVDITNNHFKFDIKQDIKGEGGAMETGAAVAKAIKDEFNARLAAAGQQLASNVVR